MNEHAPARTSPFGLMLYFLVGAATGISLALLLAPQSGGATRKMMRGKLSDSADYARERKDRLVRRSRKVQEEARRRVGGAVAALAGSGGAQGG
jgi:gas vesicle protein